jgi:hypothetical protein
MLINKANLSKWPPLLWMIRLELARLDMTAMCMATNFTENLADFGFLRDRLDWSLGAHQN